jgi:hypothetical protein
VCAADIAATFQGAGIYHSSNDTDFSLLQNLTQEATIVYAETVLEEGPTRYWDRLNTVDVRVLHGSLESKTRTEVLNGANRILLGAEILAFQTATLLTANRYRLSGLLRGLRNTEDHSADHKIGEIGVLLQSTGLMYKTYNTSILNTTKYIRAVPFGGDIDDVSSLPMVLEGQSMKPFSPCQITSSRDGSDNLTISWHRRSRAITRLYGGPKPLIDSNETYEIDVYDGVNVVRTIEVSAATEASYTAAEQTADGLTPGDPVDIIIYQTNTSVGRGNPTEATV